MGILVDVMRTQMRGNYDPRQHVVIIAPAAFLQLREEMVASVRERGHDKLYSAPQPNS